jgi:hypothetical protein
VRANEVSEIFMDPVQLGDSRRRQLVVAAGAPGGSGRANPGPNETLLVEFLQRRVGPSAIEVKASSGTGFHTSDELEPERRALGETDEEQGTGSDLHER